MDSSNDDVDEISLPEEESEETDENGFMKPKEQRLDIATVGLRTIISVAVYPLEMVKILMQLGYEPKVPEPCLTFFGRPSLLQLNAFAFLKYIKRVDGFFGCFRGITPFILHQTAFLYVAEAVSRKVVDVLQIRKLITLARVPPYRALTLGGGRRRGGGGRGGGDAPSPAMSPDLDDEERDEDAETAVLQIRRASPMDVYFRIAVSDAVSRGAAIAICYPLRTIAYQTIAEFVGRDGLMNHGLLSAARNIYRQNGLSGFYGGLVPRVIGETIQIFVVGCLGFILKTKVSSLEMRACLNVSFSIVLSAITYPFNAVSTTMSVCNSGLRLGGPPFMEHYDGWQNCWVHLGQLNLLKRGSSLMFRYYTGPTTAKGEILPTRGVHFGPDFTAGFPNPQLSKY